MTAPAPPYAPPPETWPTEASKPTEPAGPRSQIAVYIVGAVAIGIACGAAGVFEWGIAGMFALALGIAIGLLGDLGRLFRSLPGAVASLLTMMVLTVALAFVGGSALLFGCVPLVGAVILGLDWDLVRRLRPLPFGFGFLVVIGVTGGDTWTYPAGLVWLVLALGALASLEADRRAGQPQVVAVTGGPATDGLRKGDVATSVLVALAIALLAALLLSTPSCNPSRDAGSGGSGDFGDFGDFGQGSGEPGESGSGQNGSGTAGSDHLYVPDPNGQYLVPNDGSGNGSGNGSGFEGIPSPELLPEPGEDPWVLQDDDGTMLSAERLPDGSGRIVVQDPDGRTRSYTYRERSDGLIEIQERNEDGTLGRTLFYDPNGKIANDGEAGGISGDQPTQQDQDQEEAEEKDQSFKLDGRLLALIALVLAALGGLVWWLSRRTPKAPPPDAPPWAVRLAREVDREGAARGPARRRSQSLVRYADDLRAGPLPDPRLAEVADVVSTALFARTDPGPEAQRWAETTWAEIVAAHPEPTRAERRKAKAGSSAP